MNPAVAGELAKIATVRSQLVALLLAMLAIPATSLLVTASDGLAEGGTVTSGAATGSVVGLLAFGSWAAVLTAGEYTRGTVTVSVAVVPRRIVFFAAKLATLAGVTAIGALVSAAASFATVWATVPRAAHPVGNPADLLWVIPAAVAVAAFGVAAGVLTRSPVASLAVVFAVVLLPQTAGGLLGGLQPWVVGASPGPVIARLVGNAQPAPVETFPPGAVAAAATLAAAAAGFAGWGAYAVRRRDV